MSCLIETVVQQEIAEDICRKDLILQPPPTILSTAFCDDRVQRRGTDLFGNVAEESDLSVLLAKETNPYTEMARFVASGALFETFPDCVFLSVPHNFGCARAFTKV
jgi:hypothetical protein